MSPAVCGSDEEISSLNQKQEPKSSPTFSVIVHTGGKVRRRIARNESSPYFIPISNHEGKLYFNEPADDNAIDREPQFVQDWQQRRARSESSSSGCSSIMEQQDLQLSPHSNPCRCNSIHTSDYDEELEGDSDCQSNNTPIPLYRRKHLRSRHLPRNANNTRGLIEIAMRTIKLIRRNQELQNRLYELQRETSSFIETVMSNPENQELRNSKGASNVSKQIESK